MPIDLKYIPFCQSNSSFYEPPDHQSSPRLDDEIHFPNNWKIYKGIPWTNCRPSDVKIPEQGWKIHISATLWNCEKILREVSNYCFSKKVTFKYLSTKADFFDQNSKYTDRAAAGKYITIYPVNELEFHSTLNGLDDIIGNESGPYILSDRRWRNGPIFYRFGAFIPPKGKTKYISVLKRPDGVEEEDVRRPTFIVPDWVEIPEFLHESIESQSIPFPFEMKSAMHFSCGGGVYTAEALTDEYVSKGTFVVLKEARPYTALDSDGHDAVYRLKHEEHVLSELQDTGFVPQVFGMFRAWENLYLVMEKIPGNNLKHESMLRTPILKPAPWKLDNAAFGQWVDHTVSQLDKAMSLFHRHGWLLGDIHPKNIIMENGVNPKFIDFEFAHKMDKGWRIKQIAPGYGPLTGFTGADADFCSLGLLELDMLLPQATITDQGNEGSIIRIARHAQSHLDINEDSIESIIQKTSKNTQLSLDQRAVNLASIEDLIHGLARGIKAHLHFDEGATVALPGDIELFGPNAIQASVGYPYGVAGALSTLALADDPIDSTSVQKASQWILNHLSGVKNRGFAGKDGLEYGLRMAGFDELAREAHSLPVANPINPTYWSGWAGVGLNDLSIGSNESYDELFLASSKLQNMLTNDVECESAGLLYGWSGAALLWAEIYRTVDRDEKYVDYALHAIQNDIKKCILTQNMTMEYDEKWRTLPYLGTGSCGIAIALYALRKATGECLLDREYESLVRACTYYQCAQGTYAYGMSGFLTFLNAKDDKSKLEYQVINSYCDSLRLFIIPSKGGFYVRGNQGLKLSCDFLTGSAGVLGSLAALQGKWSGIPFLSWNDSLDIRKEVHNGKQRS